MPNTNTLTHLTAKQKAIVQDFEKLRDKPRLNLHDISSWFTANIEQASSVFTDVPCILVGKFEQVSYRTWANKPEPSVVVTMSWDLNGETGDLPDLQPLARNIPGSAITVCPTGGVKLQIMLTLDLDSWPNLTSLFVLFHVTTLLRTPKPPDTELGYAETELAGLLEHYYPKMKPEVLLTLCETGVLETHSKNFRSYLQSFGKTSEAESVVLPGDLLAVAP